MMVDKLRQACGKTAEQVAEDVVCVLFGGNALEDVVVDVGDEQDEQDGAEYTALDDACFNVLPLCLDVVESEALSLA
jgi:hypothetical protein